MGVLGRGLSSLIPRRNSENAEEVLDRIDSMEIVEEQNKVEAQPVAETHSSKTINVVQDFEDLESNEEIALPSKPLVTPLTMDPDGLLVPQEPVAEETTIEVETEEDTDDILEPAPADEPQDEPEDELEVEDEPEEVVTDDAEEETDAYTHPTDDVPEDDVYAEEEPEAAPVAKVEPVVTPKAEPAPVAAMASSDDDIWDKHEDKIVHISIGDISINPLQPRRTFNEQELNDLKESIEQHGILQPLVVRRLSSGEYELIAGERRLRAAKLLNWDKIPAVVRRDVASDQSRLVYALIENIQRENLNPVEEAIAYLQLNEEYGLTHEEIGERVGKSRVSITNIVRLLQLPAEIQRGLVEGKITIGHAKAILMIPDEEKQIRFFRHLLDEGLTVRKAETRARRIQRTMKINDPMRKKNRGRHPLAMKYGPALEERYGYDSYVKFDEGKNRFEVVFKAYNEGEILELVNRLLGTADLPLHEDEDVVTEEEAEADPLE